MILAIDAGNSRVKWGWHDGNDWSSIATVSLIEFAASSDHVNPFSITHEDPERIIISNVAGDGAHQLLVNWTSIFDVEPLWLRARPEQCGVRNLYERPEQLGPDRWAALIAARALHPSGPALVVNAGTATTVDMLSGDGRFLAVASVHGLVASPFKGGYVAAKHGVLGLVKVLALEGAEVGISASALCPAYVRTAIVERQLEDRSEDDLLAPQAVKRMLEPAEVAAAAAFLLGPDGRAVTGAPLVMDLGWTAR